MNKRKQKNWERRKKNKRRKDRKRRESEEKKRVNIPLTNISKMSRSISIELKMTNLIQLIMIVKITTINELGKVKSIRGVKSSMYPSKSLRKRANLLEKFIPQNLIRKRAPWGSKQSSFHKMCSQWKVQLMHLIMSWMRSLRVKPNWKLLQVHPIL